MPCIPALRHDGPRYCLFHVGHVFLRHDSGADSTGVPVIVEVRNCCGEGLEGATREFTPGNFQGLFV
jgi:hypothetical protein